MNRLCKRLVKHDHPSGNVIAAGPLNHQPHTMPYRTVLVAFNDQFVVWAQQFLNKYTAPDGSLDPADDADTAYHAGSYFRLDELEQAVACFAKRLANDATYMQSLYREDEAA